MPADSSLQDLCGDKLLTQKFVFDNLCQRFIMNHIALILNLALGISLAISLVWLSLTRSLPPARTRVFALIALS